MRITVFARLLVKFVSWALGIFPPNLIFPAYRRTKTLNDILAPSQFLGERRFDPAKEEMKGWWWQWHGWCLKGLFDRYILFCNFLLWLFNWRERNVHKYLTNHKPQSIPFISSENKVWWSIALTASSPEQFRLFGKVHVFISLSAILIIAESTQFWKQSFTSASFQWTKIISVITNM